MNAERQADQKTLPPGVGITGKKKKISSVYLKHLTTVTTTTTYTLSDGSTIEETSVTSNAPLPTEMAQDISRVYDNHALLSHPRSDAAAFPATPNQDDAKVKVIHYLIIHKASSLWEYPCSLLAHILCACHLIPGLMLSLAFEISGWTVHQWRGATDSFGVR